MLCDSPIFYFINPAIGLIFKVSSALAGLLPMFEVLYLPFMLLGTSQCVKCSEVFMFVGFGVKFPGVYAVFAGFQFSYHG